MLSGDLSTNELMAWAKNQQKTLFPSSKEQEPWKDVQQFKRYEMLFFQYPFRTLNSRTKHLWSLKTDESTSALYPANTQLNLKLTKIKQHDNILPFMLPYQLSETVYNAASTLDEAQYKTAVTFETGIGANKVNNTITKVAVKIQNIYLPVRFPPLPPTTKTGFDDMCVCV